jgi:predicted RNase H-like HicB family nuclease
MLHGVRERPMAELEALASIREVLKTVVGELAEEGRSVPADVAVSEEPLVAVTV